MRFFIPFVVLTSFFAEANLCLHPVQEASLLYSLQKESLQRRKSSESRSFSKIFEIISKQETRVRQVRKSLNKATKKLAQSLSKTRLDDEPQSAAKGVRDYIKKQQSGWECYASPFPSTSQLFQNLLIPQSFAEIKTSANRKRRPLKLKKKQVVKTQTKKSDGTKNQNEDCDNWYEARECQPPKKPPFVQPKRPISYTPQPPKKQPFVQPKRPISTSSKKILKKIKTIPVKEPKPASYTKTVEPYSTCKKWKRHPSFEDEGEVNDSFCSPQTGFTPSSSGQKNCQKAIDDIKKLVQKLQKEKDKLARLEDKRDKNLFSESNELEAQAPCVGCALRDTLNSLSQPTGSQQIGSLLALGAGGLLSYAGIREARRAQDSANRLRAEQGFEAENNFNYSLAGASLGYPFIQAGYYGNSISNMSQGSAACSATIPHYYQPGYTQFHPSYYYGWR